MDPNQNQTVGASQIQPKFMDFVSKTDVNSIFKPLQPSRTLMRGSVNRQTLGQTSLSRTSSPLSSSFNPIVTPKTSVNSVDQSRLTRAQNTDRSQMVNRFGASAQSTPSTILEPPIEQPAVPDSTAATDNQPLAQVDQPYQPSMALFNKSLETATAHNMPPLAPTKKGGRKLVTGLSALLILIIAGGLFVNLNINKLEVYLAKSKSGFSATLPSKGPAGYSLAKVSSAAGIVSTKFASNTDNRSYTITERQSLWSTQTLLDSYVIPITSGSYQLYNAGNIQVYIYGNKDATWVNNGIWYLVASNNSLSNTQLINIASSM